MDAAISSARGDGADILVGPFSDPIGRDGIIQLPGGMNTQLYWHTNAPSYAPLQTVPENRVYVSEIRASDNPTSLDATAYAFLAQMIYAGYDSPLNSDARSFANLRNYCERMRTKYYSI
jgi:hypothetical protein